MVLIGSMLPQPDAKGRAMETSNYQFMKIHVLNAIDLSKDAVHLYIGMVVFLVAVVAWQNRRFTWLCLVPVFAIALIMEALDLHDDYRAFGYFRWGASIHDIANTTFWPVILVLLARLVFVRQS